MNVSKRSKLTGSRILVEVPAKSNLSWRKTGVVGQLLPKLPGSRVRGGWHHLVVGRNGQVTGEEFVLPSAAGSVVAGRGGAIDGELRAEAVDTCRGLRGEFRGVGIQCGAGLRAGEKFSVWRHLTWAVG